MLRDTSVVFQEIYELYELGLPLSCGLEDEAKEHGLQVGAIANIVAHSQEDDFDDE